MPGITAIGGDEMAFDDDCGVTVMAPAEVNLRLKLVPLVESLKLIVTPDGLRMANTAAQIAYMQGEIKKADADCKSGNQQAALQRVSSIRDLLDSHGMSQETANAAMVQQ